MTDKDFVEVEGVTLEEALREACRSLGAERHEVEYRLDRDHFRSGAASVRLQVRLKDPKQVEALRFGRTFVEGVLSRAGIEGEVDTRIADGTLQVGIRSQEDGSLLIGRDGRTLEALQYLVSRAASRVDPEMRVSVDVEDYRGRREEALRERAQDAIDEARRFRKTVTLGPLNSYERRIVHLEVTRASGVESRSVGEGQLKRLQIYPASEGR
ncbi:KH domain-containing protein [Myxococcota bacterium]|nr:KH domain-containing protein [Myxococcota bacterium]